MISEDFAKNIYEFYTESSGIIEKEAFFQKMFPTKKLSRIITDNKIES
jgi:hypothetical protein